MIRPGESYLGQQGFTYAAGLTGSSAGSSAICMTLLTLPDGARARTHLHRGIETAVYVLEGDAAADDQAGIALLPEPDRIPLEERAR